MLVDVRLQVVLGLLQLAADGTDELSAVRELVAERAFVLVQVVLVGEGLPALSAVALALFFELAEVWLLSGLLVLADVRTITSGDVEALSAENADVFVVDAHLVAPDVFVEARLLVEELPAGFADKLLLDVELVVLVERLLLAEGLSTDVALEGSFVRVRVVLDRFCLH